MALGRKDPWSVCGVEAVYKISKVSPAGGSRLLVIWPAPAPAVRESDSCVPHVHWPLLPAADHLNHITEGK